jgi:hypothetical protein
VFERRAADPGGRYELGCLYVGTNDVRLPGWDANAFGAELARALGWLAERCERTLTLTIPLDMGRPRAPERIEAADRTIELVASAQRTLVADLRRFGGRSLVMADHVHPTALGQIAIAEAALDVLSADGLEPRVRPRELIAYETTRWGRLHADLVYAYRHAKVSLRAGLPRR